MVNETLCIDCGEGNLPTKNRSSCYSIKDKNLQYMSWSTWYTLVPCILSVLGISMTMFTIVVFVLYNNTPVVKASGRELSYILLSAIITCYLMTFVLILPPSVLTCALKRAGIGTHTCLIPKVLYNFRFCVLLFVFCHAGQDEQDTSNLLISKEISKKTSIHQSDISSFPDSDSGWNSGSWIHCMAYRSATW